MKEGYVISSTFDPENPSETLVIACHTIYMELETALKAKNLHPQIIYLKSSLHDLPAELTVSLQELIDQASESGVKQILLGYATCGNSVANLETRNCQVIIPRLDDCVTLFLGSMARRKAIPSGTYFLTHGWMYDEGHGKAYYDSVIDQYGEEDGEEIMEMMFENYKRVCLVNTHCYDTKQLENDAEEYAALIGKELIHEDGNNDYLEQLLTGPWPEDRFLVFGPGHKIEEKELSFV